MRLTADVCFGRMPPSLGIFVGMAVLLRGDICGVDVCWPAGDTTFSADTWSAVLGQPCAWTWLKQKGRGEEWRWRSLQALQSEERQTECSEVLFLSLWQAELLL